MAIKLSLDFRHGYTRGEKRQTDNVAYQYDLGHILEIFVPVSVTNAEIHYWKRGEAESAAYEPDSIAAADQGYKITAHVPNDRF